MCTADHRLNGACPGIEIFKQFCNSEEKTSLVEKAMASGGNMLFLRPNADMLVKLLGPVRFQMCENPPPVSVALIENALDYLCSSKPTQLEVVEHALVEEELWEEDIRCQPGRTLVSTCVPRELYAKLRIMYKTEFPALAQRLVQLPICRDNGLWVDSTTLLRTAKILGVHRGELGWANAKLGALFFTFLFEDIPTGDPLVKPLLLTQIAACCNTYQQTLAKALRHLALQLRQPVLLAAVQQQQHPLQQLEVKQEPLNPEPDLAPAGRYLATALADFLAPDPQRGLSQQDEWLKTTECSDGLQMERYVAERTLSSAADVFSLQDSSDIGEPYEVADLFACDSVADAASPSRGVTNATHAVEVAYRTLTKPDSTKIPLVELTTLCDSAVAEKFMTMEKSNDGGVALLRRVACGWRLKAQITPDIWRKMQDLVQRMVVLNELSRERKEREGRNVFTQLEALDVIPSSNCLELPKIVCAATFFVAQYLRIKITAQHLCESFMINVGSGMRTRSEMLNRCRNYVNKRGFTTPTGSTLLFVVDKHWDALH